MNVYRALVYFRPNDFGGVSHVKFRQMLAHALLTLGKIPFGEEPPEEKAADTEAGHEEKFCQLARFEAYKNEKHQCGFCEHKAYWYCETCFPDPSSVPYALCNVGGTGRTCFAQHVLGHEPKHACEAHARQSPRLLKKRQEREDRGTSGDRPGARRRVADDLDDT